MGKQANVSAAHDARGVIRSRLDELRREQQQLEARYAANSRVIAELEALLRRLDGPPVSGETQETKEAA